MLSLMLSQSPDSRARGGLAASRKDMDVMPRGKNRPHVTKRQILAWREEALQAELELSLVVLGLPRYMHPI